MRRSFERLLAEGAAVPVEGWDFSARRAVDGAGTAGLDVVDLREAATRVEFFDVAAAVHFLRKVVWTVPDFTVERYRDRLRALHEVIGRDGRFVAHSQRYLVEARRPSP